MDVASDISSVIDTGKYRIYFDAEFRSQSSDAKLYTVRRGSGNGLRHHRPGNLSLKDPDHIVHTDTVSAGAPLSVRRGDKNPALRNRAEGFRQNPQPLRLYSVVI